MMPCLELMLWEWRCKSPTVTTKPQRGTADAVSPSNERLGEPERERELEVARTGRRNHKQKDRNRVRGFPTYSTANLMALGL